MSFDVWCFSVRFALFLIGLTIMVRGFLMLLEFRGLLDHEEKLWKNKSIFKTIIMNTEKSRNLRDDCKNWGLNQPTAPLGLKFSDWSIQMESYIKKNPWISSWWWNYFLQLFVHALLIAFAQLSTDKKKIETGLSGWRVLFSKKSIHMYHLLLL